MKKLALFAFFAMSVSSLSFARPSSNALQLVDVPIFMQHGSDQSTGTVVRVTTVGEVYGGTCPLTVAPDEFLPGSGHTVVNFSDCEWTTVKSFSRDEMRDIMKDVKKAAGGLVGYPKPGRVTCLAMPSNTLNMTADNGKVFLRSETYPCGDFRYNTSPAALRLVELLRDLRAEYENLQ